ncbi:MAG: hypothetical protein ACOH12_12130 [Parvibaculaceae bacterium]
MADNSTDMTDVVALGKIYEERAIPLALAPTLCNRFLILPRENTGVVVFGGGAVAKTGEGPDETTHYFVNPVMAITFDRGFALDFILNLEFQLKFTEEERGTALERNPHINGQQ